MSSESTVWEFPLTGKETTIVMPRDAVVLGVAILKELSPLGEAAHILALCNPGSPQFDERKFVVFDTGDLIDSASHNYVGSVHPAPEIAWHVFEKFEKGNGQ